MSGTNFPNGIKVGGKRLDSNAAVADVTAADAVAAAGAAPTKAEYDVLVTEANETKAKLNTLLARLRTAGIIL